MRFLTPAIHSILDYAVVSVLILAPFWLGLQDTDILALSISLILGLGLLGYSLMTDYVYSLYGVISYRIHLLFDALLGIGAIAIPFIFNFTGAVKTFYIAIGVAMLVVVVLTGSKADNERVESAFNVLRKIEIRFLTPSVHGLLDYMAVTVLLVAPFAFGFADTNVLALYISLILGVGLLVYSLFTDYTYSLSGAISFRIHLLFDALSGSGAIVIPFIFGFEGAAKIYYIVMGAGVLLVVVLTDSKADAGQFETASV